MLSVDYSLDYAGLVTSNCFVARILIFNGEKGKIIVILK